MKYVLTVKKKERKGKRSGLPPITTDEVGLLVVSAGDWHGQSCSQRPRSRGPEEEIVAWHEGIAQRTGVCFSGIVPQRSQIDS